MENVKEKEPESGVATNIFYGIIYLMQKFSFLWI